MATMKKMVAKKAKSGLGMKSVKSGYDNNSGVTRADFVAIGKGTAQNGIKANPYAKMDKARVIAKGYKETTDGKLTKPKMKMGGKMAKQAAVAIAMKKAGKTPKKKMQYGGKAASMAPMKNGGKMKKAMMGASMSEPMMKSGGKMAKCKYGCK
jgi:hypothetical protein